MADFAAVVIAAFPRWCPHFPARRPSWSIGLAVQYGAHPGIWVGEMLAIVPESLPPAYFVHATAGRPVERWDHRGAAGRFLLFAADVAAEYALGWSVLPL